MSSSSNHHVVNTPITPRDQNFNAAAAAVAENVAETPQSRQTKMQAKNEAVSPVNDQQPGVNKPSSKGAKSAANADLLNFYQSLIP